MDIRVVLPRVRDLRCQQSIAYTWDFSLQRSDANATTPRRRIGLLAPLGVSLIRQVPCRMRRLGSCSCSHSCPKRRGYAGVLMVISQTLPLTCWPSSSCI